MKFACAKCQRFFHIVKNGVIMEEGMPVGTEKEQEGSHKVFGNETPLFRSKNWRPYKIFMADLYECRRCGTQLLVPTSEPLSEHYMPNFQTEKERYEKMGRLMPMIEDC